jgi:hypothetical protein
MSVGLFIKCKAFPYRALLRKCLRTLLACAEAPETKEFQPLVHAPVAGCRLQVAGCRLWVVGCGLQVVGCGLQVVGCGLRVAGCGFSTYFGFEVWGLGSRVWGLVSRAGLCFLGLRVEGPKFGSQGSRY